MIPRRVRWRWRNMRKAREPWAAMAERAKNIYVADISYGRIQKRRGHWSDRLAGIDKDIEAMRAALKSGRRTGFGCIRCHRPGDSDLQPPVVACSHAAPEKFPPGSPLALSLTAGGNVSARLHYRHVNQAERWRSMEMYGSDGKFTAAIAAEYTASPFPLQYYFELSRAKPSLALPGVQRDVCQTSPIMRSGGAPDRRHFTRNMTKISALSLSLDAFRSAKRTSIYNRTESPRVRATGTSFLSLTISVGVFRVSSVSTLPAQEKG